ncbi:MAG: hypothetical protein LBB62_07530 [Proteiniphilum sp.]|jgi:hypothetical protein|nr:hypothetical protein [Proteiniphilum sp.]
MAKLINSGDTIIGKHTDGHTRKWNWKGLKKHPVLNRNMTLYECTLNSYAEIVKECEIEDLNDECKEKYNHKLGDCLEAFAISIYVDSKRKYNFSVEAGISGRHKASTFSFRDLSVCSITTPLSNLEKHIKLLEQGKN